MANPVIVGVDEAGRGAVAGPVVAGAVVLDPILESVDLIADSKKLSEKQRQEAFEWICDNCVYGLGIVDNVQIDKIGILEATQKAMQLAVKDIESKVTPTYLLIDGRDQFWFDYPHSSVIKGDEKEVCIGAASIVAKVSRDSMMMQHHEDLTDYGFDEHKGYGTEYHFDQIRKHGLSPLHRSTFLKNVDTKIKKGQVVV